MASSARIDELRKKFDENPRRYFAPLANEYRKSGDPEQAIFICQEYLPQQPGHMSGHIVYGQALFELSRFDESRAVFETALTLDPENLIALRHLGDIARHAGDSRGARVWYQRVLEADPRNEEIAHLMLTLLGAPEEGAPAVSAAPSDEGIPTLIMEPILAATPAQSTLAIERADAHAGIDLGQELTSLPEHQASSEEPPPIPASSEQPPPIPASAPVSTWGEAPPPSADDDLLDLDDFSVGGVALSSLGAPPPAIEPTEPPPGAASSMDEEIPAFETMSFAEATAPPEPPAAPAADTGFDLGRADGPFEPDPFAIAGTPDSPPANAPIELASDIELGLPDDGRTGTTFSESQGERLADLETFGEELHGADAAEPSALEVETFFSGMGMEPLVEAPPQLPPIESHRVETPTDADEPIESQRMETPTIPFEPLESHRPEPSTPTGLETPGYIDIVTPPAAAEPPASVDAAALAPTLTPSELLAATPPVAPSEEFVTETMAELYLEQGHPEAAVDIYQRLVAQRPDDAQLADRLRAVESALRGESEPAPSAGPTIRQFLAAVLRASGAAPVQPEPDAFPSIETPSSTASVPSPAFDFDVVEPSRTPTPSDDIVAVDVAPSYEEETHIVETPLPASIDEDFGGPAKAMDAVEAVDAMEIEPAPADAPPDTAAASVDIPLSQLRALRRETPGSSETVSGSIDALFSGAGSSSADVDAAATLSQAFATEKQETPPAPLKGVPAHAASNELSLDHVFKSTQARRQDTENDSFSFDQFFSDELTDNGPKSGTEPAASSGTGGAPGDDIAQFNNWLNGLKKT
jgi:tetratricopeptide (TPR) repeat protein